MIIRPTLPETHNYTTPRGTIHMVAVLARHEAKAVVLDLMQPDRPRGRAVGFRGQAGGDEAGRQGTLQHAHVIGQQGLGESRRKQ